MESDLKSLFIRALEINGEQQRRTFLDEVCGDQTALKEELVRMLGADGLSNSGPLDRVARSLEPFRLGFDDPEGESDNGFETPRIIGPYELLEMIGEGGMGTVYLARQSHPVNREVALKLIKPGMDSREVLSRFQAEMQTLSMMQHANIASVLDAGLTPEGRPYFVMELVRGLAIDKHCTQNSVTLRGRLELFIAVCRAVQHAHNRSVIHRDLKPTNVLVLMLDDIATVKVIDFGIAKALTSDGAAHTRLTKVRQIVGTPLYMSPEQVRDEHGRIDERSDIYSLGVMLYELVTGWPPLDRAELRNASVERIRYVICEQIPQRPSQRLKLNDPTGNAGSTHQASARELDWIILCALEKEPERRYDSANDLAEDLQRFLDGNPIKAGPPSIVYRLQTKVRKHRWKVAIGTAFMLLISVAGVVSYLLYREAQHEKRLAELREKQANELRIDNTLQSAIRAMADHDLSAMRNILEKGHELASSTLTQEPTKDPRALPSRSLGRLLGHIANPEPLARLAHAQSIRGITVSSATQEVFGVDGVGQVFVCDLSLSSPIRILGAHSQRADSVAVSPNGKRLVSAASEGQVWLWDLETKQVVRELAPLASGVETLVWSPDGEAIAAGARYSEFVVYDASGEELLRQANDHRHESLLFSPDSQQLIVPTRENIEVWDITSRKLARKLDTKRITNVRTMCWAGPSARWLIAGERFSEGLIAIDFASGKTLGSFNVEAQYACCLSGSSSGKSMVAAYSNGRVQLLRLSELNSGVVNGEVELKFAAHDYTEVENSPLKVQWIDRYRFITAGADGAIKLWDTGQLAIDTVLLPPRKMLGVNWIRERGIARYFSGDTFPKHPTFSMKASAKKASEPSGGKANIGDFVPHVFDFAAAQNRMAAAGEHRIGILSADSQQWLTWFDSPMARHHFVTLSADGSHLAAASDSQIGVWSTDDAWATQQLVQTWAFETIVRPVFSHDNKFLFCSNTDGGSLVELDIQSGRETYRFAGAWKGHCALDRSGVLLATATNNGLQVWDLKDRSVIFEVTDVSQPKAFQFFEDEQVLVSGHLSGKVRAWHLPTRQALGTLFMPKQWLGRLVDFQLSPDGSGLILRYRNSDHIRPVILGRVNLGRP